MNFIVIEKKTPWVIYKDLTHWVTIVLPDEEVVFIYRKDNQGGAKLCQVVDFPVAHEFTGKVLLDI